MLSGAGAGHAFAGLDQKQGAMPAAGDQAGAAVEKLIGLPVQRDAAVRAAVAVQVDPACAAHGKHGGVVNAEATTAAFA
ncbi:hypothetical protein D9M73_290060 [compost metagenome]